MGEWVAPKPTHPLWNPLGSEGGLGPVERATRYLATLYRVMERAAGVRSGNNVGHVTKTGHHRVGGGRLDSWRRTSR